MKEFDIIRIEREGAIWEIDVKSKAVTYVHDETHPSLTDESNIVDGEVILKLIEDAIRKPKYEVTIRTFGNFDVYVDGQPMIFKCVKGKELLAVLVDRRGGFVSNREIISYLWEDAGYERTVKNRFRKTLSRLRDELEAAGIGEILQCEDGQKRLVADKVSCDYFDYMSNRNTGVFSPESYMREYSWAENTIPVLLNR